jgi:hypothetical protein
MSGCPWFAAVPPPPPHGVVGTRAGFPLSSATGRSVSTTNSLLPSMVTGWCSGGSGLTQHPKNTKCCFRFWITSEWSVICALFRSRGKRRAATLGGKCSSSANHASAVPRLLRCLALSPPMRSCRRAMLDPPVPTWPLLSITRRCDVRTILLPLIPPCSAHPRDFKEIGRGLWPSNERRTTCCSATTNLEEACFGRDQSPARGSSDCCCSHSDCCRRQERGRPSCAVCGAFRMHGPISIGSVPPDFLLQHHWR